MYSGSPRTRADIADFLALSPEAVSRATAELTRRGLIVIDSRHEVRVLNPTRFAELAGDP